ncbi:hypothetical protein VB319_09230 [Vibrio parahaemolyticus]|nr:MULTISPECIES: hypothetical protein [Vibrio harveyi group]MBS9866413.1 hypothetical protein [Vibrio alginolyticus]MBS9887988.1 hypothetical protein [Vibrio alginolyticus]MEA5354167.1 hypothetical protein [Vibrio parahaemolyticus]HAV1342842.1 hypothetical protein [Vibrio parahaemolyticus]HCE3247528.1 hypothetical protein [Vibrio parahaemolyticus]
MSNESYKTIMSLLDVVESELNKIAKVVGHVSFDEFMADEKEKKQAA